MECDADDVVVLSGAGVADILFDLGYSCSDDSDDDDTSTIDAINIIISAQEKAKQGLGPGNNIITEEEVKLRPVAPSCEDGNNRWYVGPDGFISDTLAPIVIIENFHDVIRDEAAREEDQVREVMEAEARERLGDFIVVMTDVHHLLPTPEEKEEEEDEEEEEEEESMFPINRNDGGNGEENVCTLPLYPRNF